MRVLITILAVLATACTSATEIYTPEGQQALLIECPGAAVPMSKCFERALAECPGGYVLLGVNESGPAPMATFAGGIYSATTVSGVQKRIAVQCKA